MDTTDLTSVRSAVTAINQPLETVVLNAGGAGGSTPLALTAHGAMAAFAANVLEHFVLLEQLIESGMLTSTAVLTGSESARGVPNSGSSGQLSRPTPSTNS